MSSSPTIMLSSVDFPQPDGPDEDEELAVLDGEIGLVDGFGAVGVALGDLVEDDLGHCGALVEVRPQPFTAPDVSPATMRRWKMRTMMMMGMVTTTEAAAI